MHCGAGCFLAGSSQLRQPISCPNAHTNGLTSVLMLPCHAVLCHTVLCCAVLQGPVKGPEGPKAQDSNTHAPTHHSGMHTGADNTASCRAVSCRGAVLYCSDQSKAQKAPKPKAPKTPKGRKAFEDKPKGVRSSGRCAHSSLHSGHASSDSRLWQPHLN
jgi:hypothetical protein